MPKLLIQSSADSLRAGSAVSSLRASVVFPEPGSPATMTRRDCCDIDVAPLNNYPVIRLNCHQARFLVGVFEEMRSSLRSFLNFAVEERLLFLFQDAAHAKGCKTAEAIGF